MRQILSTGWGMRDTHAAPSNLQYGPDNYIWGVVGYSGFDGADERQAAAVRAGRRIRFKPDGSDFEVMTGSTNNTWGLGFTETFDVFGSTANNDPSFYMAIPNRFFDGVEGLPTPRRGAASDRATRARGVLRRASADAVHPAGGRAAAATRPAAGHHLYTARAFPKEYWNRIAFITEPTAHLVGQGDHREAGRRLRDARRLEPDGRRRGVVRARARAGRARRRGVGRRLVQLHRRSTTRRRTGFSNGKGNAYETSLRDHQRGRIYRIVVQGRAAGAEAVAVEDRYRGARSRRWRPTTCSGGCTAQRLLVERGQKDVVPQLSRSSATRRSTRSAPTAARCTRSGRSRDSASSTRTDERRRTARRSAR